MSGEACAEAWSADTSKSRAETFDERFPACCCETHSFAGRDGGVTGVDLVARIFTTPDTFSTDTQEIIWHKLVRVYSDGLSMFRPGCTEAQIREAVKRLTTGGEEPYSLAGATLTPAENIRQAGQPKRWFCIYDTTAPEFDVHADLVGTWPDRTLSKSKQRAERESRLRELRRRFNNAFVPSTTAEELIVALRDRGFEIHAE